MPPPDDELAAGPLWMGATIEPWIDQTRARLSRESVGSGQPPPEFVRQAVRRLLRLTAVLLEDAPDREVTRPEGCCEIWPGCSTRSPPSSPA